MFYICNDICQAFITESSDDKKFDFEIVTSVLRDDILSIPWVVYCILTIILFTVSSLEPEWAAAASAVKEQTKGRVRLGAVDATVHQGVSSRYGVSYELPVNG